MKVLHVMNGPNWGGSYALATRLCVQQRKAGVDATVCHLEGGNSKERVTAMGAPLLSYDPETTFTSKLARWSDLERGYERILREWRPDIIHTHVSLSHLLTGRILSRLKGPKWVALFHQSWRQFGYDYGMQGKPWMKYYMMLRHGFGDVWSTRRCDQIVTVSEAIRRDCLRFGMRGSRVKTIYNGVIPQVVEHVPPLRDEWGIPAEHRVICSLGYFDPRKGFDLLVAAFEQFGGRHPDVHLVIAGGNIGNETQYREKILQMKASSRYKERIHILGEQNSGAVFLLNGDICVVPSRQEPASTVLIEAMHLGMPCVVTSAGGGNELARHEEESLVFENGNVGDLAAQIERLLNDPVFASRLGKAAATKARTQLTLERCAKDYIELYKEILEERGKG
ncbi:glycosyltransferase family 4 protein [bacterium]|nr:glycosyltransferase family 4 protein [bacterium]